MIACQGTKSYRPSAILSKLIRTYNENCTTLLPYLKSVTDVSVISSEGNFESASEQMAAAV
jgi:hypothetical protein